ncbi:MAG: hypothetical protein M1832_005357 [Thelocarpon impressellum]|nr:MAG: hypothetical protein M1832_005357 [Thelocarpon impressellum]
MAELNGDDVVTQTQSVGDDSFVDGIADKTNPQNAAEEDREGTGPVDGPVVDEEDGEADQPTSSNEPETSVTEPETVANEPEIPADEPQTPAIETTTPAAVEPSADVTQEANATQETAPPADKQGADNGRHVRSNSLKKPASFKAVSVTKSFLAKAVAGSIPSKLGGDKAAAALVGQAGSSAQPPPRPRLVAKTGSGLRDAAPRMSNTPAGAGPGTGPDPSQVWNKNRPAQPAQPKQFTDEELKQQYGIHLATRLQADDAGKEAKWADIDDDDDDWAPETIEWNDGTKITLPHHEEPPAPIQAPASAASPSVSAGAENDKAPGSLQPPVTGADSSVTKAGTPSMGQAKTGGLVLKGAPEKPVLVAKPPVPTPVKSPWASLPPVDKTAPVPANPNQQQAPPRLQLRDGHGFESRPAQASPATEIAVDDFNRSWRDNHSGASRELFNSQSGRYEPVQDARRGSIRSDAHHRQPSVLHRPQNDQGGPAEPSAAFQTHRSAGQEGPWGRRRTSSNLSVGSGNSGRRMSRGQQDMPPPPQVFAMGQRRGSQAIVTEHPGMTQAISPAQVNPPSPANRAFSPSSAAPGGPTSPDPAGQPQATPSVPVAPVEDPIEMQKKIMRESRELAMKRRKEQEAKEEAERKERIRIKMEALGMPPPSRTETKLGAKPVEVLSSKQLKGNSDEGNAGNAPASPSTSLASVKGDSSPTKNFGSMRVHQPKSAERDGGLAEKAALTGAHDAQPQPQNGILPNGAEPGKADLSKDAQAQSSTQPDQPWKNVPAGSDTYTSWGGTGMTTHSSPGGNLWGPPSNDKALGNGTFDRGYGRLPTRQAAQAVPHVSAPVPGPIGPPNSARVSAGVVAPAQDHSHGPAPRAEGQPGAQPATAQIQTASRLDHADLPQMRLGQGGDGRIDPPSRSRLGKVNEPSSRPGPIGRPAAAPIVVDEKRRAQVTSAWNALPEQLAEHARESKEKVEKAWAERRAEEARTGVKRDSAFSYATDVWVQPASRDDEEGGRRAPVVTTTLIGKKAEEVGVEEVAKSASGRGSRFFPQPADSSPPHQRGPSNPQAPTQQLESIPLHLRAPYTPLATFQRPADYVPPHLRGSTNPRPADAAPMAHASGSSPPPDSAEHPVYDGDANRPTVLLPSPKPVVKLPPSLVEPVTPTRADSLAPTDARRQAPQTEATMSFWQDRINGLLGSKKVDPSHKAQALRINSVTKAPLEVPSARNSATVSLPRKDEAVRVRASITGDVGEMTTRATEEALLEEREFGSLPTVRLPARAPANAHQPARALSIPRTRGKLQKPIEALSIEPYRFTQAIETSQGITIVVSLPGTFKNSAYTMPVAGAAKGQRAPAASAQSKEKRKPSRSREAPATYGPQRAVQSGAPRASFHGGNWARRTVSEAAH